MKNGEKTKIWSKKEESYLTKHYHNIPVQEIAKKLNRTTRAVLAKAKKLNLVKIKRISREEKLLNISKTFKIIDSSKKNRIIVECPYCSGILENTLSFFANVKSCGCKFRKTQRTGSEHISGKLYNYIKTHAKFRNIEFDLSIEYLEELLIKQDFKCKLSNLPIELGYCYLPQMTGSLDRINSNKGYIVNNVQWVHKKVNMSKQSLSDKEYIELCRMVVKHNN